MKEKDVPKRKKEKFDAEAYQRLHGADCLPMTEEQPEPPKYGVGGRRMDQPEKKRK